MLLNIYSLNGCPWSKKAVETLKLCKPEVINVSQEEKDKYKNMNKMNTFPQIFLVDENDINKKILIGGYNDLMVLLTKIYSNQTIPYNKVDCEKLINYFNNKK